MPPRAFPGPQNLVEQTDRLLRGLKPLLCYFPRVLGQPHIPEARGREGGMPGRARSAVYIPSLMPQSPTVQMKTGRQEGGILCSKQQPEGIKSRFT